MKIFVLGHRGMLGHVAARYLAERGHTVGTTDQRYEGRPEDPLIEAVREAQSDWVINCLGNPGRKSCTPAELYLANSIFPQHLNAALGGVTKLIHASSDGVFSGKRGDYSVEDQPDPVDVYGLSKMLGEKVAEAGRCYVIRSSIIGPERETHRGLLSWFLHQKNQANGYVNHFWNGITTLEWAKLCEDIIGAAERNLPPLIQPAVPGKLSKYEVLKAIGQVWPHDIPITPIDAPISVNRTLRPTALRRELTVQLRELKRWWQS